MQVQFDSLGLWSAPPFTMSYLVSPHSRSHGLSLLHKLILMGRAHPEVIPRIRKLAARASELNRPTATGWTPLMVACRNSGTVSTEEIVEILIGAGANINLIGEK